MVGGFGVTGLAVDGAGVFVSSAVGLRFRRARAGLAPASAAAAAAYLVDMVAARCGVAGGNGPVPGGVKQQCQMVHHNDVRIRGGGGGGWLAALP